MAAMTEDLKCAFCGAALLPEASFCRQCGSPISADDVIGGSEQPTALFPQTVSSVATQRLDPRPTSPDRGGMRPLEPALSTPSPARRGPINRKAIIGAAMVVIVFGLIATVALVRIQSHRRSTSDASLLYPGASTMVDMAGPEGGRVIQMQTTDSLDNVESWYQTRLRPTKTIRLTSTSIVLKNANTTATLAVEDNKTNILIKMAP